MSLQSGSGTWGTVLYTVRGVGSESRDVDAWTQTSQYSEDRDKWLLKLIHSFSDLCMLLG
jgi:hypothetical protein